MQGEAAGSDRTPPGAATFAEGAERLARELLEAAAALRRPAERRQAARLARVLADRRGREAILALTDEVLRVGQPARAASLMANVAGSGSLRHLAGDWKRARWLGPIDRAALLGGALLGPRFPALVVRAARARVLSEISGVVLPAGDRRLARHAARRAGQGIRLNVNVLGEAVLGEAEAARRMEKVLAVLRMDCVDYVSVKVSAVCSQLDVLAFDEETERIAVRLRELYRAALAYRPAKFVNLDMEEFRDLDLTVAVFRKVLDEEEFRRLRAGIVLQAYLPDSAAVMAELCDWADRRQAAGGAPVKIRIVKGANLAMETVDAELHGWPRAPFATKAEADANYKRMLRTGLAASGVDIGVASHNLFELAWAATVAEAAGASDRVEFEMLEGMSPAASLAVAARFPLRLYAPVVDRSDLDAAVAYLVRRLDENSAPENFIAHQFAMTAGSAAWEQQRIAFRKAVTASELSAPSSRRNQDRRHETYDNPPADLGSFTNTPDTDFTRRVNRDWAATCLREAASGLPEYRPMVAGRVSADPVTHDGVDPSRPGVVPYRWASAGIDTVEAAVAAARSAQEQWAATTPGTRRSVLLAAAAALARARGRLLAVMAVDAAKTVREGDPEVSEAVDFATWYARHIPEGDRGFRPYGTVVVAAPWNFPLSIPAGGVLAALAAGNTVILKPAPETVAVAGELAKALTDGGVPAGVLQFLPCVDGDASRRLVTHPDVDAVILTGSWETARMFLEWDPGMALHGETSGKNAMVISATADPDEAIADLVRSAFGHAGQKCSAASLAIIEAPVHDDGRFLARLADAVRTLRVGPAARPSTVVGPLIHPPRQPLRGALTGLAAGERWLVEPRQLDEHGYLWSPGVKIGVEPGSESHLTEFFGPVLSVLRATDLDQAIALQNAPDYGLTAGLCALDPAEIEHWRRHVEAGNLYVNRGITGAVVGRQPFGGWKRSVVGPGAKAGGAHYVNGLGRWPLLGSAPSPGKSAYRAAWSRLARPVDHVGLRSESNVTRFRPLRRVALVGQTGRQAALDAAGAVGVDIVDLYDRADPGLTDAGRTDAGRIDPRRIDPRRIDPRRIDPRRIDKVRLLDAVPDEYLAALQRSGAWIDTSPVAADAEREVARWGREQAVSESRHRHGNVTGRRPGLLPPPDHVES